MEHKKVENIDIEKHKELFAYEMTEVILNLRGEFAVISGKDTTYWEQRVEKKALEITPVVMPNIAVQEVRPGDQVPQIPEISRPEIPTLQRIFQPTTFPAVNSIGRIQIPLMQTEGLAEMKPISEIKHIKLDGNSIPNTLDVPSGKTQIAIPKTEMTFEYGAPLISKAKANVNVTTAVKPTAYCPPVLNVMKADITIPAADKPAAYRPPVLDAVRTDITVPAIGKPATYRPPVLDAVKTDITVPAVGKPAAYRPPVLDAVKADITVPAAGKSAAYRPSVLNAVKAEVTVPTATKPEVYALPVYDGHCGFVAVVEIPKVNPAIFVDTDSVRVKERTIQVPTAKVPKFEKIELADEIWGENPLLSLPQTDLGSFSVGVRDVQTIHPPVSKALLASRGDADVQIQKAWTLLNAVRAYQAPVQRDTSGQMKFAAAMQIDISFVSAESFFKDFSLE